MIYEYGNFLVEVGSNELAHHGIKGQKWGVRRYQNEDGTRTFLGKRRQKEVYEESEDHVRYRKLKSRDVASLSNKELQEIQTRMNLENSVKNAMYKPASSVVTSKLLSIGKNVVNNLITTYASKAINAGIKYSFGDYGDSYIDAFRKELKK